MEKKQHVFEVFEIRRNQTIIFRFFHQPSGKQVCSYILGSLALSFFFLQFNSFIEPFKQCQFKCGPPFSVLDFKMDMLAVGVYNVHVGAETR